VRQETLVAWVLAGTAIVGCLAIAFLDAGVAGLVLVGLCGLGWLAFEGFVLKPQHYLAGEMRTMARAKKLDRLPDVPRRHALGELPGSVLELTQAVIAARGETTSQLAQATANLEEQKRWLEVILHDLSEGVVVCSPSHQILLYNHVAAKLFRGVESMGLGRSLFGLITQAPVMHALETLEGRLRQQGDAARDLSKPFICSSLDASVMFQARMGLIHDENKGVSAYVVSFTDISSRMVELARSDVVRRMITQDLRQPAAAIRAVAETMASFPEMVSEERHGMVAALVSSGLQLSQSIDELTEEYRGHALGNWSMADIYTADLFNTVSRHMKDEGVEVTGVGMPLWLHGDSYTLMLTLEYLIRRINAHLGVKEFDIEALLSDHRVYAELIWQGEVISPRALESWLDEPVEGSLGAHSARDVLERHGSEPWSHSGKRGMAALRIPLLAPASAPVREINAEPSLPPRPEFYDFGLLAAHSDTGSLGDRPMRSLTYVVFDTETTGLRPSGGDEIISIGAVRVVNGRVVTGENFLRLVNPKREIPKESIQFHHITDDMVKDKPPIEIVLPQFKSFVGDAVLVAHNAAFDLKFLAMKEEKTGVKIANPVLDTLLLSSFIDEHIENHSLDAIANRFVIDIPDRHTALGDALATAAVLVRLFDLLEAKGLRTFSEVMRASNMTAEVRMRQANF
jgi:DNA polymerase-3 subunit epsilon